MKRKGKHLIYTHTAAQPQPPEPQSHVSQPQPPDPQLHASQPQPPSPRPQASQPQPSDPQTQASQPQPSASQSSQHRTQGPTMCNDVYNMDNGQRIKVGLNELDQPMGEAASLLSTFLGTLARNGQTFPLDVREWRSIPKSSKEDTWDDVLQKFIIPEEGRDWVMQNLDVKWKEFKFELKKKWYKPNDPQVECGDGHVNPVQWKKLVEVWNSEHLKKRSEINKANRSKAKYKHCAGTKSFVRVHHNEKQKTGEDMHRASLLIETRVRVDEKPLNDNATDVMTQINEIRSQQSGDQSQRSTIAKDDILAQVIGEERRGRPTPSSVFSKRPKRVHTAKLFVENEKLTQQLGAINKELSKVNERISRLEAEMRQFREIMMSEISNAPKTSSPHHVYSSASNSSHTALGHDAPSPPNVIR